MLCFEKVWKCMVCLSRADVSTSITPLGSFQTQTFGSEGSVESMDDGLFLAWGRCREKLYFQAPRTPLNVFNDKLVQQTRKLFLRISSS